MADINVYLSLEAFGDAAPYSAHCDLHTASRNRHSASPSLSATPSCHRRRQRWRRCRRQRRLRHRHCHCDRRRPSLPLSVTAASHSPSHRHVRVIFAATIAIPHRPRHLAASASPSPTSRIAIDIMLRISWSTRGHSPLYQSALLKHLAQSLHSAAHKHCTCVTHRGCALSHLAAKSSCSLPTSSGSSRAAPSPPSILCLLFTGASITSRAATRLACTMHITASHHTRWLRH